MIAYFPLITSRLDATPTEAQVKLAISQVLSLPSVYNNPVIVLDFEIDDNGTITGKFKDAARPRVFSYEIADEGISFKPFIPQRTDSLEINPKIWEDFSAGYTYRIDAVKRRKEAPTCSPSSFNCGLACISLKKTCKVPPTATQDPTSTTRIETAKTVTKAYAKGTPDPAAKPPKKTRATKEKQAKPPQDKEAPKTEPKPEASEPAKKASKSLIGKGTHETAPNNAQEYYDMMTKKGNNITKEEAEATVKAIDYWSKDGYKTIRSNQQQEKPDKNAELIDNYIKNSTPFKGEIFRGISFESEDAAMQWIKGKNGDGVLDNQSAHASWSSNQGIADNFSKLSNDKEKTRQSVIVRTKNKSGVSISNLSDIKSEDEVIVPKEVQHKVKKVTRRGNTIVVEVEEVEPGTEENTKVQQKQQPNPPQKTVTESTKFPISKPPASTSQMGELKPSKMTPEEHKNSVRDWQRESGKFVYSTKKKDIAKFPLIEDSNVVIWMLKDNYGKPNYETTAIKDDSGTIQGFYMTDKKQSKNALYIDSLGVNPQNIIKGTKGVGKSIMYSAIKESIDKGFKGKIKLTALDRAAPFYEAVGFKPIKGTDGGYELSEEAAKAFMSKYEASQKAS